MWNDGGFAPQSRCDVQRFLVGQNTALAIASSATGWQTWVKPPWAKMVHIMFASAGGGGGGGKTGASLTVRGGGGGGGSGMGICLLVPAIALPRTIVVVVGRGGAGGAADLTGTQGGYSAIYAPPLDMTGSTSFSIMHGQTGGAGGTAGTGAAGAGGTPGGAGGIARLRNYFCGATSTEWSGSTGGSGGTPGGAAPTGGSSVGNVWAGSGGGAVSVTDVTQAGGTVANYPYPPGRHGAAGTAGGGAGGNQPWPGWDADELPLLFPSTGGGGGTAAAVGGVGGDGYFVTGGGGGGGGTTGGAGGRGGDGFCIITSW